MYPPAQGKPLCVAVPLSLAFPGPPDEWSRRLKIKRFLRGAAITGRLGACFIAALATLCLPTAYAQRMYDGSGRQIGRVDADRYYDASGHQIGRTDGSRIYDGAGRQIGRIEGDRVYSASGTQIGRIDGDRLYSASGTQMGRLDGDRLYDSSGRQIGRADALRRMQVIVFFYFFM